MLCAVTSASSKKTCFKSQSRRREGYRNRIEFTGCRQVSSTMMAAAYVIADLSDSHT
jgi:hypothetical protein